MFDGNGGRPSKELFELLFEQSAIGLCMTELDGRVFGNQAFADMLGYGRDEVSGRSWKDITHPEDVQQGQDLVAGMLAGTPERARFVKRYLHKSGRIIWGEVASRLHRDAAGAPKLFLTSILDITERKEMERELLLRNTILATEHEAFPDGILVVDTASRVLSHNRRFLEIFGIPKEVMETRDDRRLLAAATAQLVAPEAFLARVEWLYRNPLASSREEVELKDGRLIERLSAPMIAADGENLGRVWFFRDATERKRTETILRDRLSELERWQDVMLDREDRVGTLKHEVNELCRRLGEPLRYPSQDAVEIDASDPTSRTTIEMTRFDDPDQNGGEVT
jgi:PAS domain S-box-containing protein